MYVVLWRYVVRPGAEAAFEALAAGRSSDHSITFTAKGSDGTELLMNALAVSRTQSEQFSSQAGGATLMLVGGQRIDLSDNLLDALQQSFKLTKAEARLAGFLVKGSGVRGYVADRGVITTTGVSASLPRNSATASRM